MQPCGRGFEPHGGRILHSWFSGRIPPCHGGDPSSILGECRWGCPPCRCRRSIVVIIPACQCPSKMGSDRGRPGFDSPRRRMGCSLWSLDGVVGHHVRLTRERSPVRTWVQAHQKEDGATTKQFMLQWVGTHTTPHHTSSSHTLCNGSNGTRRIRMTGGPPLTQLLHL